MIRVPFDRLLRAGTEAFACFVRCRKGVAAVEFAMIVPIMFMLFVGSVEFSQAITVDRRVTQVASSTADLVARERSITNTDISGIMQIIDQLMEPYDPSKLKLTLLNVYSSMTNASDTKVCWSFQHNGGVNSYSNDASYTLPTGILEAGNSVVVTEVRYNYEPLIFRYFITSTFPLEEKFFLKPRLSKSVQYSDGTTTRKCL